MMLQVRDIEAAYGATKVLHGVSFEADAGEVVCLAGRNGAGKTTALKSIMGLVATPKGEIRVAGEPIRSLAPEDIPRRGVGYVPQGRRLFGELTVAENLEIGLMARGSGTEARARALSLFPVLQERLGQRSSTLSGGEQQMLAIARALCIEPTVLLLDEPTEGLQPSMVTLIREVISTLKEQGVVVVLVEQRIDAVRAVADRVVFFENGRTRETVQAEVLDHRLDLLQRYLGIGAPQ